MGDLQTFLSICLGIGLSAACGFRVFVPLLCLSVASHTGYLHLDSSFAWIGTTPALIAFAVATVVEIGAYYIPFVDNLLDSIAVPAAAAAGIFVAALAMTDVDPFWRWTLAIVAGGGIATSTQLTTTKLRALSSATTAGFGNPVLATIEGIVASILSIVAVVWPVVALILAVVLLVACWLIIYSIGKRVLRLFRRNRPTTVTSC
ncbi:MAG TPA: DUF4126 domain-containing protein [Verrucomicrobiae bacterium]|nr:DUF4126 domain-containing protein [Verrucomicrobiae bacterium]